MVHCDLVPIPIESNLAEAENQRKVLLFLKNVRFYTANGRIRVDYNAMKLRIRMGWTLKMNSCTCIKIS